MKKAFIKILGLIRWKNNPIGFSFIVVFVLAVSTSGKTLEEYKENITHIKNDFASIFHEEWGDAGSRSGFEREIFEEVKKLLPEKDFIEIDGKTIEADNSWLTKKIESYKNEPEQSDRKRLLITEIYERLEAIEKKVEKLGSESSGSGATKDAHKRKIAEILAREEFQTSAEEDESFIQWLIRTVREWLNDMFPRPQIQPNSGGSFESVAFVFQLVLYALIIGIIGFLIYRFGPFLLGRLRKKTKPESDERVILGERLAPGETPRTLFSEAERLANEGDLKAAIRKGYIALLFEMNERKVLGLAKHKTNRDYLRDVKKRQSLHRNMKGLTSNYERHWYGFDSVELSDWEEFRSKYKEAIGSVG